MSVKEGRQKSAASRPAKSAKSNSPVTLKKQAWTAFNERNVSPSTDDAKASTKLFRSGLARNSVESSKSSLRSSTGSCHDACKFGCHGTLADSNGTAKFGGKSPAKKVCKVGAAKLSKPAISRIAVVKSPVRSRNSVAPVNKSVTKTPRESLGSVNGRVQNTVNGRNQNAVNSRVQASALSSRVQASALSSRAQNSVNSRAQNSVNSRVKNTVNSVAQNSVNSRVQSSVNSRVQSSVNSRESFKPSRASIGTPEGKFKVARSLFRSPVVPNKTMASKICDKNRIADSKKWQSPIARSLLAAFENPSGDLLLTEAFEEYNCQILDDKAEEEFFRQYYSPCEPENAAHRVINSSINSSAVSEISYEAISCDQFSEINSPRSLDEMYKANNNSNVGDAKMRLRRANRGIRDCEDSNPEPESVFLRHQDTQGRKDYLIDHVMEEAVSKLSHCEESKVKVLVGAFETVISLRDSHDAAGADHTRPLQECN